MLACSEGKVPYSLQNCFPNKVDFPDVKWVEQLIKENNLTSLDREKTDVFLLARILYSSFLKNKYL